MKKNKEIKLKISEQMFELISKSRETNGARIGFGLAPSERFALVQTSLAAREETPLKFCLKNEVSFLSSESFNILCNCPR